MSKTDLTIYKWIKSTNYTLKIVKKYIEKVVCNADDRHYLIRRKHLQIDNKKTLHRWRSKEYEKNRTERASPNGQWNYEILNSLIVKYRLKSQWAIIYTHQIDENFKYDYYRGNVGNRYPHIADKSIKCFHIFGEQFGNIQLILEQHRFELCG